MDSKKVKVLIADDHSMIRSGLRKILKEEADIEVTAEAATHSEVLSTLSKDLPDLVLLDISMPGRDGLETLKEIKVLYPRLKVLMLSMHQRIGMRFVLLKPVLPVMYRKKVQQMNW